jgi:hypothetical protein
MFNQKPDGYAEEHSSAAGSKVGFLSAKGHMFHVLDTVMAFHSHTH